MNEQLSKGLGLLISRSQDTMALERLVAAMEACLEGGQYDGSGVVTQGHTATPTQPEAIAKPKHPLEDYQITEKDVGSLVLTGDTEDDLTHRLLTSVEEDDDYPYTANGTSWGLALPYLDPVALHFIPHYATPDSVAPDDLGEHFAVLLSDGDVIVYGSHEPLDCWQNLNDGYEYIIGYRPLKFVNPLKQDK